MSLRILLLTHAFNGLAQRLFVELRSAGHVVSVELDIADSVTEAAVARFAPDVVLAPYLKRRIPERLWSTHLCLIVHPGPPGDRGPAALDWALLDGEAAGGVTVLQATGEFDAGPVWASCGLVIEPGITKGRLYREAVTEAAVIAVKRALARVKPGSAVPAPPLPPSPDEPAEAPPAGQGWRGVVPRERRTIDWAAQPAAEILRRVRSADGSPGAAASLFGEAVRLHDVHEATAEEIGGALRARPGEAVARRGPAVLVRCSDAALWVGHVRRAPSDGQPSPLKLPATRAFADAAGRLDEWPVPLMRDDGAWDELRYAEYGPNGARVGWLDFEFHNGAMSERQAVRLRGALREIAARETQVLVLAGGREFFSHGIHLHEIEAAAQVPGDSAADASWRAIEAIDDVCLSVLQLQDRWVMTALRGNAGAGGCFLALTADEVLAREAVVLNAHYRNMGNLYGSEYWTYLLPRRVGEAQALEIQRGRLPMGARQAQAMGLVDGVIGGVLGGDVAAFEQALLARALATAADRTLPQRLIAKQARRAADEALKPLAAYRAEELAQMRRNFYGFDPSYHVARHHFVHRKPHARTPRHLQFR